ncbi:sensor domain-containing diguanylate cyclase [Metabacillus litoralis]|uniref:sensor domain-containing diguanylate cyclase n=1 Tax=Metabacillus litoralis TaxID=152268 RepID=UPI002041C59C|nr:sensor domain-containing diguanylate cyclase [Metabacillus litoralis]MCM3409371.1 sensor domain-containing diguanylate cyclase [Metabacillus litoralis]
MKIKNRKVRLSTLLTKLVAGSVILTTVILLIASYQYEKESLTNAYLNLNYSKSSKMSRSVDSLFKSMRMSLEETATFLSENDDFKDDEIQDYFELLRNNSRYFNSLSWIDGSGVVRSIAPISVGLRGEILSSGETRKIVDSKRQTVSQPYIAPSGRLIVLLAHPFYDQNNHFKGMIGGSIYLQEQNVLTEILGNDIIDENGSYYYVVGPEGKILFHPDKKQIGEDVSENPIVGKIMQGKSGKEIVTNTMGVTMLAAYSVVPETGWGVVQQTPVSFIYESLYDHLKKLLIYILIPFVSLLALSIFIARKLAKPFFDLSNVVNQISSGKLVSIPEMKSHWNREADLLTKSVTMAIEGMQDKHQQLSYEATTDSLTNTSNRRLLDEVMKEWVAKNKPFTLIAFDIDNFKKVNDTFGHQTGDQVLQFVVKYAQMMIRKNDLLFRYGGEEFVLLIPNVTSTTAYSIAEKIRICLENNISPIGKPITISLGIAEFPLHTKRQDEIFDLADQALYVSKSKGKNRTTIWNENL